jgi:flagellar biosynthesis component FlhA
MKKTLLSIAMMAIIFSSCNNSKKEEHSTEQNMQEDVETVSYENHETDQEENVLNNNWMNEIQLDNGNKWIANIETNEGIQKMKDILKTQPTTTIEEYHQLASELTVAKNYVIKECTMKGPSHDNLHIWLLPLLEKIDALSETNNLEEASKIKQSIAENVHAYDIYFK